MWRFWFAAEDTWPQFLDDLRRGAPAFRYVSHERTLAALPPIRRDLIKRHLYLVPASGAVEVNGVRVNARDGAAIRDEAKLTITALEDSELVLVDAA